MPWVCELEILTWQSKDIWSLLYNVYSLSRRSQNVGLECMKATSFALSDIDAVEFQKCGARQSCSFLGNSFDHYVISWSVFSGTVSSKYLYWKYSSLVPSHVPSHIENTPLHQNSQVLLVIALSMIPKCRWTSTNTFPWL